MKYLFFLILISSTTQASITFKWIGTTTFSLSDGDTTLLFDPSITHVSILDLLPWATVKTNENEVDYWLNKCNLKKIDAVLVNHAHYDHVIDAPYIIEKYGGTLFGSSSTVNVGLGAGLKPERTKEIKAGDKINIGKFSIEIFKTPHSPHFWDVMLADGHIETPLKQPANVWDYKVGNTLSFFINHPELKILYQAIGRVDNPDPLKNVKTDVLLLTIANRRSSKELIEGRVIKSNSKKVIPLHHDNFLLPKSRDGEIKILWGQNLEEFEIEFKKSVTNSKLKWPKYCEGITL